MQLILKFLMVVITRSDRIGCDNDSHKSPCPVFAYAVISFISIALHSIHFNRTRVNIGAIWPVIFTCWLWSRVEPNSSWNYFHSLIYLN